MVAAIISGCTPGVETSTPMPPVAGTAAQIPADTSTPTLKQETVPTTTRAAVTTVPPVQATKPQPAPETTPATALTPLAAIAPQVEVSPLTVLSIIGGEVLVKRAGMDTWEKATSGTTLQPGDSIKTGGASRAKITFFEGSTVELEALSEVLVSEIGLADTGSTTICLVQQLGKTVSRVQKLTDADSHYEIATPAAIGAVRGSTMVVCVTESGKTEVWNLDGDIRVIVDNVEYLIHEGMKRTIIPGQKPGPEESIYPPRGGGGGGGGGVSRPPSPRARLDVTLLAEPQKAHVGENITYTCLLRNTGDLPFLDISVNIDVSGNATYQEGDIDSDGGLDPGETWIFTSCYTLCEDDPSPLVATATVSTSTSTFVVVVKTETATASATPGGPGIALDKTASVSQAYVGDNITYTYSVTNTGDTTLLDVSVVDDRLGNISITGGDLNENNQLDVEELWVFSANYTVSEGDPSPLVNTAEASGRDALERPVSASANASVAILRPGITLDKTASVSQAHVGDNITYTYSVTNAGLPVMDVSVVDDRLGSIPFSGGDDNGNGLLDSGEIWVFSANYTVSEGDPSPLVNTAEASGRDALERPVSASANASVAILRPGITLDKTAAPLTVHICDIVTYTYTVNNTGNTPLADVSVSDDRLGEIPFVNGDSDGDGQLDTGETWIFRAAYWITQTDPDPLVNTAIVSGTDALFQTVSASDTASVTIEFT
jgi:uncharacterized repeat protein (TIGR01451 family)